VGLEHLVEMVERSFLMLSGFSGSQKGALQRLIVRTDGGEGGNGGDPGAAGTGGNGGEGAPVIRVFSGGHRTSVR
jgi:hypothetical protein